MLNKGIVRELYLKGYNAVEISKQIKAEVEAIRKCIQRNFSNLNYNHRIAIVQRKEEIRAVNYESKRYISDKSFILKNRSIYKTRSNGDIVINKNVSGTVTWDTPKRLSNENKE